jgi:hypothetical protein
MVLVGRGPEADVRIDHPSVSRIHARIERDRAGWVLADLDSGRGTFLNGLRVARPTPLRPGDVVRFGEAEAGFELGAATAGAIVTHAEDDGAPPPRPSAPAARPVAKDPAAPRSEAVKAAASRIVESTAEPDFAAVDHALAASAAEAARRRTRRRSLVVLGGFILVLLPIAAWAGGKSLQAAPTPPTAAERDEAALRTRDQADRLAAFARRTAETDHAGADPEAPAEAARPDTKRAPDRSDAAASDRVDRPADLRRVEAGNGDGDGAMMDGGTPPRAGAAPDAKPRPAAHDAGDTETRVAAPSLAEPTAPTAPAAETTPPRAPDAEAHRQDPAPAKPSPAPVAVPTRAPSDAERFRFRRLAFDLFGRPPTEAELGVAAAAGTAATLERWLASPERAEAWFEDELYGFLLLDEFRPGPDRLDDLPGRLTQGKLDVRAALVEIAKSQQFNARNPGNDTYCTVVLEQFLGLTVQDEPRLLEAAKAMYDGRAATLFGKSGRSQADFVDLVSQEPRFAAAYVARRAAALLGAPPARADLERWLRRFRAAPGDGRDLDREILLSPAYETALKTPRKKSDRLFLAGLWHDLLGRAPGYQELRNLRNASQALTDPTALRSLVLGAMLNGGAVPLPKKDDVDPARWIEEQFVRLFARRPSQAELGAFTATWRKPACRPATILHALLTSPEYDRY